MFYIILIRCSNGFLQIVLLFFQLDNIYVIFCEVLSDRVIFSEIIFKLFLNNSFNLVTFYSLKLLKLIFHFNLEQKIYCYISVTYYADFHLEKKSFCYCEKYNCYII